MPQFLAPIINNQWEDVDGATLSGGTISVYYAGTSTPAATTSDKAGLIPNTWPIVLNTLGVNAQGSVWLTGGSAYKYVIKNAAGVTQRTIDNINGINDSDVTGDQWVIFEGTPTYVSATSFTVPGDQTGQFQTGRRIRAVSTGAFVFGTIISAVYGGSSTTVTIGLDSALEVLDAGLTQVYFGVITPFSTSLPLMGNLSTLKTISSATALDITHCGAAVMAINGPYTITLPLAAIIGDAAAPTIYITNLSTAAQTISRTASDTITMPDTAGYTTFSLRAGETVTLVSNRLNGWLVIGGSVATGKSASFKGTAGASGYQYFPSGLLLQYGTSTTTATGVTVTYPIAFPSAVVTFNATAINNSGSGVWMQTLTPTLPNTYVQAFVNTAAQAITQFAWTAIGY